MLQRCSEELLHLKALWDMGACAWAGVCVWQRMCVCVCMCVRVCMCLCADVHVHVHVCVATYVHAVVCVATYVRAYVWRCVSACSSARVIATEPLLHPLPLPHTPTQRPQWAPSCTPLWIGTRRRGRRSTPTSSWRRPRSCECMIGKAGYRKRKQQLLTVAVSGWRGLGLT